MMFGTACLVLLVAFCDARSKRATEVIDKGTHVLICQKDALEMGIVFDSSSSIPQVDFDTGKTFLQNFLQQFDIGQGDDQVRVSIITFGRGVFPEDGFNLDTYNTKEEVIDAIGRVRHRATTFTATGEGIRYMHNSQLSRAQSRTAVPRVAIVFTDGNSQEWRKTKDTAAAARADGVIMFAVGIGLKVDEGELLNIAGDQSRVARVDSYDELDSIKEDLARHTCIRKEKPTTAPPSGLEECGRHHPSDVYFVFSPATLGLDVTAWTTQFISRVIDAEGMDGFRYGVVSGDCPLDAGFDLDEYNNVDDLKRRLAGYDRSSYATLIQNTVYRYGAAQGGRSNAQRVAVLVADGKYGDLSAEVRELRANNVRVFVADPRSSGRTINGATTLVGRSSAEQAANLITRLCS